MSSTNLNVSQTKPYKWFRKFFFFFFFFFCFFFFFVFFFFFFSFLKFILTLNTQNKIEIWNTGIQFSILWIMVTTNYHCIWSEMGGWWGGVGGGWGGGRGEVILIIFFFLFLASNEYPQHILSSGNKKNINTLNPRYIDSICSQRRCH